MVEGVDTKFFNRVLKNGGAVPQSKKWGTPRSRVNYTYGHELASVQ